MPELELSQTAQQWVTMVLVWIGFGTLVGLLARAMLPGREPGGAVGTIMIGILGSAIGPLVLTSFFSQEDFNPISPLGFVVSIGAAFLLLIGYRLLASMIFVEREEE